MGRATRWRESRLTTQSTCATSFSKCSLLGTRVRRFTRDDVSNERVKNFLARVFFFDVETRSVRRFLETAFSVTRLGPWCEWPLVARYTRPASQNDVEDVIKTCYAFDTTTRDRPIESRFDSETAARVKPGASKAYGENNNDNNNYCYQVMWETSAHVDEWKYKHGHSS